MSKRLTDDYLKWLATKALNDDIDHLASEFYDVLVELQERRKEAKTKDPWNRDVEALRRRYVLAPNMDGEIYVIAVVKMEDGSGKFMKNNDEWAIDKSLFANAIAWLPWEG